MTLINLSSLPSTERTRPLINELKRIVFDANIYIMQDQKGYPYGERCYKRAMKLIERINEYTQAARTAEMPPLESEE